jgi:uncharacterized repeat protein (TIGR03803 family)
VKDQGIVFELHPASKKTWQESVVYSFCAQGGDTCTDGAYPVANVTLSNSAALFGTTVQGGTNNGGVVFQLSYARKKQEWKQSVLYRFCSLQSCTDGFQPNAWLLMDQSGNLFGTTAAGGTGSGCTGESGCGVVFELAANGTESVLHDFCYMGQCSDGAEPLASLIMDSSGNLYGTTPFGGLGLGTVFELNGSFQVLYDFCSQANCTDGAVPYAPVIIGPSGNLFGTTGAGYGDGPGGVVFELAPTRK